MTELEKMQRAKMYIDKLANGINPLSDTALSSDSVLNEIHLLRCFFYVSDILQQVIDNGGQIKKIAKKRSDLLPFELSKERRSEILINEQPVMISHFTNQINSLINDEVMRKLKTTSLTEWLVEKAFLREELIHEKRRKIPTVHGKNHGITVEERSGQYGTYTAVMYNSVAQQLLIDNLDEIIDRTKE